MGAEQHAGASTLQNNLVWVLPITIQVLEALGPLDPCAEDVMCMMQESLWTSLEFLISVTDFAIYLVCGCKTNIFAWRGMYLRLSGCSLSGEEGKLTHKCTRYLYRYRHNSPLFFLVTYMACSAVARWFTPRHGTRVCTFKACSVGLSSFKRSTSSSCDSL